MNKQAQDIFDIIDRQSPHLSWARDRTVLLVKHGSQAYGTATPTSDTDYKGVLIPPKQYYLGSQHRLEQIELKAPNPDCVIYEIRKFFNLASAANPSVLETLFVDPSDHILVDPIGEEMLAHRRDFLSTRVKHTFSGYAIGQLKRIKLHRKHLLNPPKAPPTRKELGLPEQTLIPQDQLMAVQSEIQKELDKFQFHMDGIDEATKINLQNTMTEMLAELKITTDQQWESCARKIGMSDNFIQVMQKERQYTGLKREWDQYQEWKRSRNKERYALEEKWGYDCKHAGHLVRLLRCAREILTTGQVNVRRPDAEELLTIRNGAWTYDQVVEFAEREDQALQDIYKTCSILPKTPDQEKLDQLCIRLVEKSLSKTSWYSVKKRLMGFFG
jgi:predicted nucleotidyltransferase